MGIPKVAAEDTSIVAGNDRGEKKVMPILKGTGIFIDIIGTHYNRTYLVFIYCAPNKIPFQLVTGMTRIHSTLHVFSKIGLVMPLCHLVLVRNRFFPLSKSAFFLLSKYVAGARACIGRKYVDFTPF
jgi:hypothetical protein